jgi:actin-like ATPase involved in cell morphogenesis
MTNTGRGVDIGTAYIVSARSDEKNTKISSVRDCFLALPLDQAPALEISGVEFIEGQEEVYVVGNEAVNLVGVLGGELRRPLSKGFISAKEEDGKEILQLILQQILGKPEEKGEMVAFSVPGPIFDADSTVAPKASQDTALTFHTSFFKNLITDLGYTAKPLNEAVAVCFNETVSPKKKDELPLTGLAISFGAGTTNIALVYKSLPVKTFALPFGGDYVDQMAAKATDSTISHITILKERGVDLMTGKVTGKGEFDDTQTERQAEAIAMAYADLLHKLLGATNKFFAFNDNRVEIPETIPVVISGGTTKSPNFMKLFNKIFIEGLDVRFKVSEARVSQTPLDATASGCLNYVRILQQKKEK